jgi:CubicO group peptidase (beta-lactamase class C family)
MSILQLHCGHSQMERTDASVEHRAEYYLREKIAGEVVPGLQYVVVDSSGILFSYAGGKSDITNGTPMTPATTMMTYSITKTFTAVAILQLVERGKLQLDDPVRMYLKKIQYDSTITIRQLLAHTSGIPNPIPLRWVHLAEEDSAFSEQRVLDSLLQEYRELDFKPGERYSYSNIGYWLLGKIIEQASGISYAKYLQRNIFGPLNVVGSEAGCVIPVKENHSKGYLKRWTMMNLLKSFFVDKKFIGEYENGWLEIKPHYLNGISFGGIVTSGEVLSKFLQDQLRSKSVLFKNGAKKLLFEEQRSSDGKRIGMTLGWHIGAHNGTAYFYKEGGGAGFHGLMRMYPASGIGTVILSNSTTLDVAGLLNELDKLWIESRQVKKVSLN